VDGDADEWRVADEPGRGYANGGEQRGNDILYLYSTPTDRMRRWRSDEFYSGIIQVIRYL
jgi:hypothetical protein